MLTLRSVDLDFSLQDISISIRARLTELLHLQPNCEGEKKPSGERESANVSKQKFQVRFYFGGHKSDLDQPVFFVYGNDKLLISADGYLSRSSPWFGKGTESLQPSDRPHFRRHRSHLFIWRAEMKG